MRVRYHNRVNAYRTLEASFYRTLNRFVEPAVRAGFGSPCITPSGLIVLETTGRHSGQTHRTPVVATLFGGRIFASTARGGTSQWLKNLAATPTLRYWQGGRLHEAEAVVYTPDGAPPAAGDFPPILGAALPFIAWLVSLGAGFAVLTPHAEPPTVGAD